MTFKQGRILFFSGAWFNWIVGIGLLYYPLFYKLLGIGDMPADPLFIHLFAAVVMVFGYGYYRAGKDPAANQGIVVMGMVAKLAVAAVVWGHGFMGQAPWQLAALAGVDLVYAVLFGIYLKSFEPGGPGSEKAEPKAIMPASRSIITKRVP